MGCIVVFFILIRHTPAATRTDTLFPYTTLFRSHGVAEDARERVRAREGFARVVAVHDVVAVLPRGHDLDRFGAVRFVGDTGLERLRAVAVERSEGRRVGKEWISTCNSRRSPYH